MTTAAPERAPARGQKLIFWGLLAAQLAVLWALPAFVSQDGPIHLEIATVLRRLWAGDPAFARFFAINPRPEPNWLVYLPLAGLLRLVSPDVAEKLLVSAYLIAFPLALRWALCRVRPAAAWLAVLAFPLAASYPLYMGFYNFCFAAAGFFLAVGCHAAHASRPGVRSTIALALALLLVAAAHPVGLLAAGLVAGCRALGEMWSGRRAGLSLPRLAARHLGALGLAALPGLAFVLAFVAEEGARDFQRLPLAVLVRHLGSLYSIDSFSKRELWVSVPLAALLALLVALGLSRLRRRGLAPADGYGLATLGLLAAYFLAPVGLAGGGYLNQRLLLFVAFAALLWIAADAPLDRFRAPIVALVAALALVQVGMHGRSQARLNADLAEYRSVAAALTPGSTLLSASFAHRGSGGAAESLRIEPFQHMAGRLAAERGVIDLTDYQADRGYFPVVYRPECDPYRLLGSQGTIDDLEDEPPRVDLGRLPQAGCGEVDFVLVWGLGLGTHGAAEQKPLLDQLAAGYERVSTSPRGLAELYRRRSR